MNALRCFVASCLLGYIAVPALAIDQPPGPRPISDAERQAIVLAMAYFDQGAKSWWDHLASDSPLRALGEQDAIAEIRARLGPTANATWQLATPAVALGPNTAVFTLFYPSGLDETVRLELVPEDGWRIRDLRTRVDPVTGAQPRLGALLPLRDALAEGRTTELEELFADPPQSETLRRIAQLWESQYRFESLELDKAAAVFNQATRKSKYLPPLAWLQRARLRLGQLDSTRMAIEYDQAVARGIDYDHLRLEAAEAERLLGFLDEEGYQELAEMGTRVAEVYYRLARTATLYKDPDAVELFRLGWQLEPWERSVIFSDAVLARLAVRPEVHELMQLATDREPRVVIPPEDRQPLEIPAAARLRQLGSQLVITIGDLETSGEISIPGGSTLAPADIPYEDAAAARKRREEEALAQLDTLARWVQSPKAFTNLRLRGKIETAALVLQRTDRWAELLELTDGMPSKISQATVAVAALRALGLVRANRPEEADSLLDALVEHATQTEISEAGPTVVIAEVLFERGKLASAVKLLEKANSELPRPSSRAASRGSSSSRVSPSPARCWIASTFASATPKRSSRSRPATWPETWRTNGSACEPGYPSGPPRPASRSTSSHNPNLPRPTVTAPSGSSTARCGFPSSTLPICKSSSRECSPTSSPTP